MKVSSAVKQVRDGFALTGVPTAPTGFVELIDALLDAADPPAPVPAMLSAFVSRIGLTHPNPGNDNDKMAYELLVIFASMLQHAEDMTKVRGGGDRGANSGVAAMLGIIARLGCYATDTAVQTAFINALSKNGGDTVFNGLVTHLVRPVNPGAEVDITGLIPASVPPILPPAERPGDGKIVRKIELLIGAEANKMEGNTGGIVIIPPMPSIFAKYYVEKNLNVPTDAASKAKEELDRFPLVERARQIRLVPRKCVVPHGGYSNASKWAELYDALDLAISPLPPRPIATAAAPVPHATEQRPTGPKEIYEWEDAQYDKVPYRLADRNRHRR